MEKLKGKTEQEKFSEKVALSNLKKEKSSTPQGKRSASSPEMNVNFLKKLGYTEKEITKLTGYRIEEGKIKLKDLIKEEVKATKFIDWNDAISKLRRGEIIYVDPQTNKDWNNEFHKDFNRKTGSLDVVTFADKYGGEYLYSKEYAAKQQNTIDNFASDVWYKNKKFKG